MRILVFSWRDPKHPLAGGAEQVMHEHMKGWIKAGHEVTLFSSRYNNLSEKETIDGINIVRQGYQYIGVQITGFVFYLKNRKKFDLVIDQFHGVPFFTPLYVRVPKLAVIQETARKVWFLNHFPWPLNWLVGFMGYFGEPLIFLLYKNIPFITGSESAKKDVASFGIPGKNIIVIPHGVIVQKPLTAIKKEKNITIIFLGVLSKDKGIEDALKCFALLKGKGDFRFWVIGRPETLKYGVKINQLVKKLKLEKSVKFWGFVSQEKKFELLARGHVLINPSVREGWGLVNIEANSMSTPVIAYTSAGLVDSVKNEVSGILCSQNNPQCLAESILNLFMDYQKFQQLQQGALKWSQKFTWDKSNSLSLKLVQHVRG